LASMGVRWLVGVLVVAAVLVPGTAAAVGGAESSVRARRQWARQRSGRESSVRARPHRAPQRVGPGIVGEGSAAPGTAAVGPGIVVRARPPPGTAAVGPGIVGGGLGRTGHRSGRAGNR